jgi:hypothetical protein
MLSETDVKLIQAVNAHLSSIGRVSLYNADEPTLIVVSGSLRALLVENMLGRAWRVARLGGSMTFKTWCIVSTKGPDVVAFCGGGDLLPGVPFSAARGAQLAQRTLDLKDFLKRARIQVGATKISAVELVKYVANRLGGDHFDPEGKLAKSQKSPFDLLRKIETGEISFFIGRVGERNLIHHELLSVAQAVLRSPEVKKLREWPPN